MKTKKLENYTQIKKLNSKTVCSVNVFGCSVVSCSGGAAVVAGHKACRGARTPGSARGPALAAILMFFYCKYGGQRTTLFSQFSPSTFTMSFGDITHVSMLT